MITSLATVGVVLSTFIVGGLTYLVLDWMGLHTPYLVCLLFGALISQTDPIAVLGIMTRVGAPKSLETKVAAMKEVTNGIEVTFEGRNIPARNTFDRVLVSVGRRPNSANRRRSRIRRSSKGMGRSAKSMAIECRSGWAREPPGKGSANGKADPDTNS